MKKPFWEFKLGDALQLIAMLGTVVALYASNQADKARMEMRISQCEHQNQQMADAMMSQGKAIQELALSQQRIATILDERSRKGI